eukprot:2011714-Prymnesium_polylepis.1
MDPDLLNAFTALAHSFSACINNWPVNNARNACPRIFSVHGGGNSCCAASSSIVGADSISRSRVTISSLDRTERTGRLTA